MKDIVIATRSDHKAAEIRRILAHLPCRLRTLRDIDFPETDEESTIENAATFVGNARAKARWFFERCKLPVIADDSGLEVFALGGLPGVRTRRFAIDAGYTGLEGIELDHANNRLLLERLEGVPDDRRGARYVCAAAFCAERDLVAIGTCDGVIAREPVGSGGFGYDPLFLLPDLQLTFAQVSPDVKHSRSHRARAFRALATLL